MPFYLYFNDVGAPPMNINHQMYLCFFYHSLYFHDAYLNEMGEQLEQSLLYD